MCGIAGKVNPTERGAVDREVVAHMCAALEHRGPDSRGLFVEGNVGLGIQRLRVVDLVMGDQPIFNDILGRPKQGFSVSIDHRLQQGFSVPIDHRLRHELRESVREALLDTRPLSRGYFKREAIESMLGRHARGAEEETKRLWALYMLEQQREFADGEHAAGACFKRRHEARRRRWMIAC